jgi:hypothetical protein
MQSDGVDSIAVKVTNERLVSWIAEVVVELGTSKPSPVLSEQVDDEHPALGWSIDRDRVTAVVVEVPDDRNVTGVAEEEFPIGVPLSVRIAQVDKPVRLAIHARCIDAVAVPVAEDGEVAGIAVEELLDRSRAVSQMPDTLSRIDQPHIDRLFHSPVRQHVG